MAADQLNWLLRNPAPGGTRAATFRVGFALRGGGQSGGVLWEVWCGAGRESLPLAAQRSERAEGSAGEEHLWLLGLPLGRPYLR